MLYKTPAQYFAQGFCYTCLYGPTTTATFRNIGAED